MKHIYFNGKVYTGSLPLAEAFAVENGKFIFAGSSKSVLKLAGEGDVCTDLKGRFVCSGFNDSHMHLLGYGNSLCSARLAARTESLADMLQCLKEFYRENPCAEGEWLMGRGWNQDQVSEDVPVCAVRACGHCLVVNTKALQLLGITKDTPQPEGGCIGMDEEGPDGRFFDNAMDLVYHAIPVPDKEGIKNRIRLACRALNSYGSWRQRESLRSVSMNSVTSQSFQSLRLL